MRSTLRVCVVGGCTLGLVAAPVIADASIAPDPPGRDGKGRAELRSTLTVPPAAGAQASGETAGLPEPAPSSFLDRPGGSLLRPGARVRVLTPELGSNPVTGYVVRVDGQSLALEVKPGTPPIGLRESSIRQLEVSLGRQRGTGEGAKAGAIVGGLVGVVLFGCFAYVARCEGGCPTGLGQAWFVTEIAVLGGASLAGPGAAIGALIGSAVETEKWQPIPARRVGLTIAPRGRGGVAASLSIRF